MCPSPLAGIPLRGVKYLLLSFFLYIASSLPARRFTILCCRLSVVMDVKILDLFRHMGTTTLISMTVLLIASLFMRHALGRIIAHMAR